MCFNVIIYPLAQSHKLDHQQIPTLLMYFAICLILWLTVLYGCEGEGSILPNYCVPTARSAVVLEPDKDIAFRTMWSKWG